MVGRLSNQKGLDLVDYVISDLMKKDIQLVVLGMGEGRYFNLSAGQKESIKVVLQLALRWIMRSHIRFTREVTCF